MKKSGVTILSTAVLAAGCGLGSPSPWSGLAYGSAGAVAATYAFADSMRVTIQAGGMGDLEIDVAYRGTAVLSMVPAGDDVAATLDILTFDGNFSNPLMGSVSAGMTDIDGPFRIAVTPRGETEIIGLPRLTDAFQQVAGPEELLRDLFVRLPAGRLAPDSTWTDTIRGREENGETLTIRRSILTATVAGDTLVDGRTATLIETSYENTLNLSGTSGGTRISQRLSGTTTGWFLWDRGRAILLERREHGGMTGTLSLPDMGIAGLPVEATLARRVRLEP